MDTFDLLPSLAAGSLSETSGAELVSAIFRSRASGTLALEGTTGEEIRVFFQTGDMCGCALFSGFRTLAQVLLAHDWVGALDIDSSRAQAAAEQKRHGQVLVESGLLTAEQLKLALAAQHRENLAALLAITEGKYEWRGWEPPPPWAKELTVDPVGVIVEAFESERLEARRAAILAWLGEHAARLSVEWPELSQRIVLAAADRRAAALLALPRTLADFITVSRLEASHAEALLVMLLLAGGVEPHALGASAPPPAFEPLSRSESPTPLPRRNAPAPRPVPSAPPRPAPSAPPRFGSQPPRSPTPSPGLASRPPPVRTTPPGSRPASAASFERPARRMPDEEAFARLDEVSVETSSALENAAQDEPLSFTPQARAPATDALELVDTGGGFLPELDGNPDDPLPGFHSADNRGSPSAPKPFAPPTLDDERGADMRRRMRARGLRNLGQSAPPPEQHGEGAEPAAPPHERDPAQANAPAGADPRLLEEIRVRARLVPQQNAYQRLSVNAASTSEAVKAAYIDLVKRYHPDRATQGLEVVATELRAIFEAVKEAYDLIATAPLRATYDKQMREGQSQTGKLRTEEAQTLVKMGEVLLKKRDFAAALQKLRKAVELDSNGDSLAALAWGLMSDPGTSPAAKDEAASLIQKALRAPGLSARTYYVAGVLWRTKDPDSAADAFRKSLELEPNHSDASLELRLLEMRGKSGKGDGAGGVLSGLLFGKRKG